MAHAFSELGDILEIEFLNVSLARRGELAA
jgi:hypothetical protein